MLNIPNIISILRFILSISLFVVPINTLTFWTVYFLCGLSDVLDGFLARALDLVTSFGSTLDSLADIVFDCTIIYFIVSTINISRTVIVSVIVIFIMKIINYLYSIRKYEKVIFLHLYSSKLTGILLFSVLPAIHIFRFNYIFIMTIIVAFMACFEEFAILILALKPESDTKSLYHLYNEGKLVI